MTEKCAFCGAKDQPLHYCSGCRQRKYCRQACQRAAWRAGHKAECKRLRAAASSASTASTSRRPGGERGGPITPPSLAAAAATSSELSSQESTRKQNKKKSKPRTNTTNGPAAVRAEQLRATETKSKYKNGEKTMWVTMFKCFKCGKRGHDLVKCGRCEEAYYCDRNCQIAHARAHAKA